MENMIFKKAIFTFVLFLLTKYFCMGQARLEELDKFAKLVAISIDNELKDFKYKEQTKIQVIILPFYDNEANITQLGRELSFRIAYQLQMLKPVNIIIRDDKDLNDTVISNNFNRFNVQQGNESQYLKKILDKIKPDYAVFGEYGIDNDRLYIKSVNIYSNWYDNKPFDKRGLKTESIKVKNNESMAEIKNMHNTLIKGWDKVSFISYLLLQSENTGKAFSVSSFKGKLLGKNCVDCNYMYLYFNSPAKGYLAVYNIQENTDEVSCLIPSKQMLDKDQYCFEIEKDKEYVFFKDKGTRLITGTNFQKPEINYLYLFFSDKPFDKPSIDNKIQDNAKCPIIKKDDFDKWKNRLIKEFGKIQVKQIRYEIIPE